MLEANCTPNDPHTQFWFMGTGFCPLCEYRWASVSEDSPRGIICPNCGSTQGFLL